MKTITIKGIITGTSNKQSEDYEGKSPKKSIYLAVDKENQKILEDFGLTMYTSKEKEGEPSVDFFICKASTEIKRYNDKNEIDERISGVAKEGSANFSSNEFTIELALMEGFNKGNKFYRVYAIKCDDNVVTENEPVNPFA